MENYKTLELVNQFYFEGSILEFYQGTLYSQFIRELKQRRFGPRKSTRSEAFSNVTKSTGNEIFPYYYMGNFCNLIGLEQWYYRLI